MNCCLVIDISKFVLKIISVNSKDDKIFLKEEHVCSKITMKSIDLQKSLNIEKIINEVEGTILNLKTRGYKIESISVNSCVNDIVFLDENNNIINDIHVKDQNNFVYLNKLIDELGMAYVYRKTGVSFSNDNIIYKIMRYKLENPEKFSKIKTMLMFSDYINFRLTGIISQEKTQFSLIQFFNFKNQNIDSDILEYLEFSHDLNFNMINFSEEVGICKTSGAKVIAPYGNNLTSSFLTTDVKDRGTIFIVNSYEGVLGCTEDYSKIYLEGVKYSLSHQIFDNSLVKIFKSIPCYKLIDDFLKNVENSYVVENVWNDLRKNKQFDYIIDFDSDIFKHSTNLINIIKYYFDFKLNSVPESISNFIKIVYDSFAVYYRKCIKDLEKLTGGIFDKVCMVGDYTINDSYNQFIADVILKDVEVGPKDSGIIGNGINQLIAIGKIKDFEDAYRILKNSFKYTTVKYSGNIVNLSLARNIV